MGYRVSIISISADFSSTQDTLTHNIHSTHYSLPLGLIRKVKNSQLIPNLSPLCCVMFCGRGQSRCNRSSRGQAVVVEVDDGGVF